MKNRSFINKKEDVSFVYTKLLFFSLSSPEGWIRITNGKQLRRGEFA